MFSNYTEDFYWFNFFIVHNFMSPDDHLDIPSFCWGASVPIWGTERQLLRILEDRWTDLVNLRRVNPKEYEVERELKTSGGASCPQRLFIKSHREHEVWMGHVQGLHCRWNCQDWSESRSSSSQWLKKLMLFVIKRFLNKQNSTVTLDAV